MTLELLQRKIKNTQDLRGIVNTMKTLSSVSILQYEQANRALDQYRRNLRDAFHAYVQKFGVPLQPKQKTAQQKHLVILIGSDNGMVGKFNREIMEKAAAELQKKKIDVKNVLFLIIGKRLMMLAEQQNLDVYGRYSVSNSVKAVNSLAETIIIKIDEAIRLKHINTVTVWFHKHSKNSSVSVEKRQILPFDFSVLKRLKDKPWPTNNIPLITLAQEQLLPALINESLLAAVSSQLNYSLAAEHYTRMTNMQNAEKNIDENLAALDLEFQQKRQEMITDELIDVISASEALK
ncbi:MAG: F0F1 ATP synthase subunit gamma [Alphaproteobacteria bacterium]|nr:F0F1 ATP synthase subunit gamma [Alphaproteobacteria bacterium]